MKRRLSFLLSCALLLETQVCHAENSTGPVVLTAGRSRIALSPANGSILAFGQAGQQGSLFRSGEFGFWQVRFRDGKDLGASSFSTTSQERRFRQEVDPNTGAATMTYRSADLEVAVSVRAQGDSFEFSAELSPKEKTVLEFTLPARLRFSAEELEHLVCPADGNHSVGTAFLGGFFKKQTEPTSWTSSPSGPNGYETLFGSGLVMRGSHVARRRDVRQRRQSPGHGESRAAEVAGRSGACRFRAWPVLLGQPARRSRPALAVRGRDRSGGGRAGHSLAFHGRRSARSAAAPWAQQVGSHRPKRRAARRKLVERSRRTVARPIPTSGPGAVRQDEARRTAEHRQYYPGAG